MEDVVSPALLRQILESCQGYRDGNEEEISMFVDHYKESIKESKLILTYITKCWRDKYDTSDAIAKHQGLSTSLLHAANVLKDTRPTANELLVIALGLPHVARAAALECLLCINSGHISGRTAIYCISHLRVYLLSLNAQSTSSSKSLHVGDVTIFLRDMVNICISPLQMSYGGTSNTDARASSAEGDGGLRSGCLDLLPAIMNTLSLLAKQMSELRKELGCRHVPDLSGVESPQQVIDSAISGLLEQDASNAAKHASIGVFNCCCDLFPYLDASHIDTLEKHMHSFALTECTQTSSDQTNTASLMRICLLLLEHSRDPRWVHLFRVIYSLVPVPNQSDVEFLTEQLLAHSQLSGRLICSVVEDTAAYQLRTLAAGISDSNLLQTSSGKSIPCISVADVRILLLLSRVHRQSETGHGGMNHGHAVTKRKSYSDSHSASSNYAGSKASPNIAAISAVHVLPPLLDSVDASRDALLSEHSLLSAHMARSLILVLLCSMRSMQAMHDIAICPIDPGTSQALLLDSVLRTSLQITSAPTDSWLVCYRATELINSMLYAASCPGEMQSCFDLYVRSTSNSVGMNLDVFVSEALISLFALHALSRAGLICALLKGSVVGAAKNGDLAQSSVQILEPEEMFAARTREAKTDGSGSAARKKDEHAHFTEFASSVKMSAEAKLRVKARASCVNVYLAAFEGILQRHMGLIFNDVRQRSLVAEFVGNEPNRESRNACVNVLVVYTPVLLQAQLPLFVLEKTLLPMAMVSPLDEDLYDVMLGTCRKGLIARGGSYSQHISIRALVATIGRSGVPSLRGHSESVQALAFALSLPLQC